MIGLALEHPEWLGLMGVTLACVAALLALSALRARRRVGRLLGRRSALGSAGAGRDALLFVALLLIGIALLGPRIGERSLVTSTAGADIVMLLDVSQSMDAADVPPSRLKRAVALAGAALERLGVGDRVALAAFSGRGVLFTPLTHDHDAIGHMLPALDSRMIRPGGTDLAAGIEAAVGAFELGSDRPRVVLVLSDGEHVDAGSGLGTVSAVRSNTRLIAVALGSEAGAVIPDRGASLRDPSRQVVISRRQTALLARLVAETGGEVFIADRWGEVDAVRLTGALRRDLAPAEQAGESRRIKVAVSAPFAAAAALLLWLEALPPRRRVRRRRRSLPAALLASLVGAVAAGPCDRPAGIADSSTSAARSHFAEGLDRADAGQDGLAESSFRAAAVLSAEDELAALALYNLGVLALSRGELEAARDRFFEAMTLRPEDHQIRFNLEWTLMALERGEDDGPPGMVEQKPTGSRPPDPAAEEPEPTPPSAGAEVAGEAQSGSDAQAEEARRPSGQSDGRGIGEALTGGGQTTPLDEAERRRWIEGVEDDPGRAMRVLAQRERDDPSRQTRRGGPTW